MRSDENAKTIKPTNEEMEIINNIIKKPSYLGDL